MGVTTSSDWDCKGDPIKDLIVAKEWYEKKCEEEMFDTGERDLWVSDYVKNVVMKTPEGIRALDYVEKLLGIKITLRTPREIGAVQFESEMIMNEKSIFNPLPTIKRLSGEF